MRGELTFSISTLFAFLLVLTRVSGVFAFVPIPGLRASSTLPKAVISVALTIALMPLWPTLTSTPASFGVILGWIASEAILGLMIGVAVAFITEAFLMAMQVVGLQAGYSYASTIDPSSEADSSILQVLAQLMANLLFFIAGMDREIIRAVGMSLDAHPPGTFFPRAGSATVLIGLGTHVFTTGLRLAMPVVALLMLVDLTLALTGRIHAQLQLLSLAFPVKMIAALAMLAALVAVIPVLYEQSMSRTITAVHALLR